MKINRLLTAALITFATVLTGCVKESVWDRETGIDSSKAAPEGFSFDANESSNTAIAVYWNGDAAKAAGAQSFLVQLTDQNNMDKGNTWDSSVTQVYQITDNPADYTAAKFEGLVEGKRYYVRVRANYPGSVYSQWAYVASPEGKELQCEVGTGPMNPDAVKPETLTYNASKGTATSMTFDAVATAAKSAGAKGLVYRLVNYETGIAVVKETAIGTLTATFDELELKSQHKAKVAAVYETAEGGVYYSEWTSANALVTNDAGAQVKTELFEVGIGAIEDKGVRPRVQLVYATSGELAVEWTSTGFKNPKVDFESEYSIQLYRDNACTDLVVSWKIAANRAVEDGPDGKGSQLNTPTDNCPRFAFSGLASNTTYYAVVTNLTTNMTSSPVAMKTAEFTPVMISATPAAAGDIILAEDFSELIWGGTHVTKFPGYSSDIRNQIPFIPASGENPVGLDGTQFYVCDSSIEIGFFNTLALAVPGTRLATWGSMTENGAQDGKILARQGHLKLGASNYIGRIVTPALSNLSETATIELSFKAALYGEDVTTGGVWVITSPDDVTKTKNLITNAEGASSEVHKFDLGKSTEWTTHTVEIPNVTPESRIMIGNIRTAGTVAGTDQQRMYLDEIVVKVVSYGGGAELVPPTHTSITLTTAPKQITATWNPVEAANGYVLAYKKATEGDDAWTEVRLGKSETTYTIEGLKELTTYEIKVKATAFGDKESEWSSIVSATTPKNPEAVKDIATAEAWIEFITGDYISSATDSEEDVITLIADIDFAGVEYPAGAEFRGVINGNGKTIKNLRSNAPLFKKVTKVMNLTLDASCEFTTTTSAAFAAVTETLPAGGELNNVVNNAAVTATWGTLDNPWVVGGLAAYAWGNIENCTNNGAITLSATKMNTGAAGGIVGFTEAEVNDSKNAGAINIHFGVAGNKMRIWETNKWTKAPSIGGIVGLSYGQFAMAKCENTGKIYYRLDDLTVSANYNRTQIGGIVGAPSGDVVECTNKGEIELLHTTTDRSAYTAFDAVICVGGIGGGDWDAFRAEAPEAECITNYIGCVNEGNIIIDSDAAKSNSTVGGIVGWPGAEKTYAVNETKNCINRGNITIKGAIKGRFGGIQGGTGNIVGCENYGDVNVISCHSASACALGAGFHSQNHKINNTKVYGTVTASTTVSAIGGFIGNMGNAENTTGENCVVDCTIVGGSVTNAGMVVGKFNGEADEAKRKRIVLGPLEVSGTLNGNPASASNLCGTDMYVPEYHTINATIK